MLRQQAAHQQRLDEERTRNDQLKHLQQQLHVNKLDQISTKKAHTKDLSSKLQDILQHFQHVSDDEKEKIVLGAIDALHAHVSATAVLAITDEMDPAEKDKLMGSLFRDEMKEITQYVHA